MKLTVPQKTAVYYNGGNLLLSAAAGSGKTASLTERIVRLVLDGEAKLSEMLVVTYTRAAAGEMRARIRKKLSDALYAAREESPAVSRRASEALAELPSASISTIHSFLYREMRRYLPSIGMPGDVRIMDTGTAEKMKADVMRDTVDDFFDRRDDMGTQFLHLADVIGQARDTTAVDRELLWMADKLTASGLDARALFVCADDYRDFARNEKGFFETKVGSVVMRETAAFAEHYVGVLRDISAEFAEFPEVMEKYGEALSYLLDWLSELSLALCAEDVNYTKVKAVFEKFAPPDLGRLSSKYVCHASEKFKFFRDRMKKDISRITENFFSVDEEEIMFTAKDTAVVLYAMGEVLSEYYSRLRVKKISRGLVDYSDLETLALELFTGEDGTVTDAAYEVASKYKYVFIDEYQDTNLVQDTIFRAVSKNSVRFMVGDIKQSIYRFRRADPRVFSHYRVAWDSLADRELITDGTAVNAPESIDVGDVGRSLFMSDNFRCDSGVVDFVNMVSDYTLSHGSIPYEAADRLICSKNGGDTAREAVDVVFVEKKRASRKKADDADGDGEDKAEATVSGNPEAAYVASRIASMIGKYSADGERVIKPSDIAIIMRSPGTSGEDYERELSVYGIPSRTKQSRTITSYPSVMLLMCILNFIDNPMRDIYAAGALHSAVFGFTLADVIALRETAGDMPLYTAIVKLSSDDATGVVPELCAKCRRAESLLNRYKAVSRGMSSDKFLEYVIGDTGFYSIAGVRASGEERGAVEKLCEMARAFESSGMFGGLSGFIDYVAESEEESADAGDSTDAVQIMSIHSSKGLEFPIVFLAECGKRRNTKDESGTMLYDDEVGFGMMLPGGGGLAKCDTVIRRAVADNIKRESVAEEMRMLYVALTRAANTLVVSAKTENAAKDAASAAFIAEVDDGYDSSRGGDYIDLIVRAAAARGAADFYNISVVDAAEITSGMASGTLSAVDEIAHGDEISVTQSELLSRFNFEYPRNYLEKIPSKLTVSRLYPEILDEDAASAMAFSEEDAGETEAPRPSFMTGVRGSAAERGSATHVFMQFANFDELCKNGAEAELLRLISGGFISEKMAQLVELTQIERFAHSRLVDKMRRAPLLEREFRFNVRMAAADFTSDAELKEKLASEDVKITVQGVVDAVFRDPDTGELVLVDYKTDRVTREEWNDASLADAAFRARHKNQLTYYKEICSRLFGEEIAVAEVYSTVLARCIEI